MEQYIKKSALVAWAKETYLCENASMIRKVCFKQLLEHLNTLEVKEVDIDKEIKQSFIDLDYHLDVYNRVVDYFEENIDMIEYERIAKHFFELGLKTRKGKKI